MVSLSKLTFLSKQRKNISSPIASRRRYLKSDEKGAALLEAAIVFPLLLIFLLGIIDLGGLLYNYLVYNEIVGEAAKLASRTPGLSGSGTSVSAAPEFRTVFNRMDQMYDELASSNTKGIFSLPNRVINQPYIGTVVHDAANRTVLVTIDFRYDFQFLLFSHFFGTNNSFRVNDTAPNV